MQAEFHLTCLINANPVQFPTFGACGNPSRVLSIVRCTLLTKRRPWFHSTICEMLEHLFSGDTMPTPFHFCLEKLALEHRLVRNYTRNIDCLEHRLPGLEAKTIRLHGQIDQVRCQKCNSMFRFELHLFQSAGLPDCEECQSRSHAREVIGRRPISTGQLRPDVLLYGHPHPEDGEIVKAVKDDMRVFLDMFLAVGTRLSTPGAQSIAEDFCHATRSVGGTSFWISKEAPASKHLFDHIIIRDCDEVVTHCEGEMPSNTTSVSGFNVGAGFRWVCYQHRVPMSVSILG
jgi:NAD-dependent SIR2 family protein deacetylase